MKGVRFYEEFANKRKGISGGTCIAVFGPYFMSGEVGVRECISAVYWEPNAPVCGLSVSDAYLRARCKRVSEARAREIHPALFERLEAE